MIESEVGKIKDVLTEHGDTVCSAITHYGNNSFDKAVTKAVTNAYFSSGSRAVGAAGSVALDYSTGAKGFLGKGLNVASEIDESTKGNALIGGAIGGINGYLKGGTQDNKEQNVGQGVMAGAIAGGTTFAVVTLATGGLDLPFLATAAIMVGVGSVVAPLIEKANDWIYKNVPVIKDFENGVGAVGTGVGDLVTLKWNNLGKDFSDASKDFDKAKQDVNKMVGQAFVGVMDFFGGGTKPSEKAKSRDSYEKAGHLKIQRGNSYSGGVKVTLDADQVNALAKTISSKTDDYANKLIAINNSIPQKLEDAQKEVRKWAMKRLSAYNYLTPDDVDEILSEITVTYNAGDVQNSNQKIRTLAKNLMQVSSGLQKASQTLSETDSKSAQGFKADPMNPLRNYQLGFK